MADGASYSDPRGGNSVDRRSLGPTLPGPNPYQSQFESPLLSLIRSLTPPTSDQVRQIHQQQQQAVDRQRAEYIAHNTIQNAIPFMPVAEQAVDYAGNVIGDVTGQRQPENGYSGVQQFASDVLDPTGIPSLARGIGHTANSIAYRGDPQRSADEAGAAVPDVAMGGLGILGMLGGGGEGAIPREATQPPVNPLDRTNLRNMGFDEATANDLSRLSGFEIPTPEEFLGRPLTPDHIWNDPRFQHRLAMTSHLEGVKTPEERFNIAGEQMSPRPQSANDMDQWLRGAPRSQFVPESRLTDKDRAFRDILSRNPNATDTELGSVWNDAVRAGMVRQQDIPGLVRRYRERNQSQPVPLESVDRTPSRADILPGLIERQREMGQSHDMESLIRMANHTRPGEFSNILDTDLGEYGVGGAKEHTPLLGTPEVGADPLSNPARPGFTPRPDMSQRLSAPNEDRRWPMFGNLNPPFPETFLPIDQPQAFTNSFRGGSQDLRNAAGGVYRGPNDLMRPGQAIGEDALNQGINQAHNQPSGSAQPPDAAGAGVRRTVYDVQGIDGQSYEMVRNPSRADLARLTRPNGGTSTLRYIKDEAGNIYVAPAESILHRDMASRLMAEGVVPDREAAGEATRGAPGFEDLLSPRRASAQSDAGGAGVGPSVTLHHGSARGPFGEFEDRTTFFSRNADEAQKYSSLGGRNPNPYVRSVTANGRIGTAAEQRQYIRNGRFDQAAMERDGFIGFESGDHVQIFRPRTSTRPIESAPGGQYVDAYRGRGRHRGEAENGPNAPRVETWTASPDLANDYAGGGEGAHVLPGRIDPSEYLHVDARGRAWNDIPTSAIRDADVRGAVRKGNGRHPYDPVTVEDMQRSAQARGYKGIAVHNVVDRPQGSTTGPTTVYRVFDQNTREWRFGRAPAQSDGGQAASGQVVRNPDELSSSQAPPTQGSAAPPVEPTETPPAWRNPSDSTTSAGVNPSALRQMRQARQTGENINREQAQTESAPGTETDFMQSLPTNPEQWRDVMGVHPWINSPSRAQATIMASAKNPDGSFRYSTDEILNQTGLANKNSLGAILSQARANGVPIPSRLSGPEGSTAPKGGNVLNRVLGLLERTRRNGDTISISTMAERLGLEPSHIRNALAQVRSQARGSLQRRNLSPEIIDRLRDLDGVIERPSGRGPAAYAGIDPDDALGWLALGGYGTALGTVAGIGAHQDPRQQNEQ